MLCSGLCVFGMMFGSVVVAAARPHLVAPTPKERAALSGRLDKALFPAGAANLHVEAGQIFSLVGAAGNEVTLVPVLFTLPNPPAGVLSQYCGAYIFPVRGRAYFLDGRSTEEDVPVQCWKVLAVRLDRRGAMPPNIVFVGSDSLTTHSWKQDYVLTRSGDGVYKLSVDYKDAGHHEIEASLRRSVSR